MNKKHKLFLLLGLLMFLGLGQQLVHNVQAESCLSIDQVQADSRCLYVLNNKVYQMGTKSSPHMGHFCGMDVSGIIPANHLGNLPKYLTPQYRTDICSAIPTVAPSPTVTSTPIPTNTPLPVSTPTSEPKVTGIPTVIKLNQITATSTPIVLATETPSLTPTQIILPTETLALTPTPLPIVKKNNLISGWIAGWSQIDSNRKIVAMTTIGAGVLFLFTIFIMIIFGVISKIQSFFAPKKILQPEVKTTPGPGKIYFVRHHARDTTNNITWVTLTNKNGTIFGQTDNLIVEEGWYFVDGTITEVGGNNCLLISSLRELNK